jgi:hypothetical protein
MTFEDAERLCPIIGKIDGGCTTCIDRFIEEINEAFPEFVWSCDEGDRDWFSRMATVEVRRAKE